LRDAERGTFAVARDWTDLAAPKHAEHSGGSLLRLDLHSLCELVELIEAWVDGHRAGGVAK
jgi:hypothetical protein